jgi:ATP-binding cassette, subfamily B, bacterial MsbA
MEMNAAVEKASWGELRRWGHYLRPYQGQLALGLVSLLISSVIGLAAPWLIGQMLDSAFTTPNTTRLNQYILLVLVVYILQATFGFFRTYLCTRVGDQVVADLRRQVYRHLLALPVQFFAERRIGELTSRLSADVTVVYMVASSGLLELLRQLLVLSGGVVIIALTNTRLTLVMLGIVPPTIAGAVLFGRYLRRLSTTVHDKLALANAILDESLTNVRVVQSFVREEYEISRYGTAIDEGLVVARRQALMTGGFVAFIIFVIYGGIAAVLWYGGRLVLAKEISQGEMVAFVMYTFYIAFSIGGLAEVYSQFQRARGATQRIFEILDTVPSIATNANPQIRQQRQGAVKFVAVNFSYPNTAKPVLTDINLTIAPGEVVALVGPSGGGKTTLVNLLPRFYEVTTGSIYLDGHNIQQLALVDLRQAIGIVPQETQLFSGTIRENIAYGCLTATEAEIKAAAQAANAHDFIVDLPTGYETVVGERGVKLSGGQRQRIAIARALLKNPQILILDEATSALDSESERLVQEALERLMAGRTTLVIAHRLATVRHADKIAVLESGKLVAVGPHADLIEQNGLYRSLYELQFKD